MMPDRIVEFHEPVTLLGGGMRDPVLLQSALERAPKLIAADGGANMAVAMGLIPDLVIGDFDSISEQAMRAVPDERRMLVTDQDTTDFEKCLARVHAPLILGVGFTELRLDHALTAMSAIARNPTRRCMLLGEADVVFASPPEIRLSLELGTRLSLFPMRPVQGESHGLRWPIDGIAFSPAGPIGTSNEVTGPVLLRFRQAGMLVILPVGAIDVACRSLMDAAP